jgi:hypothetical protein
VADPKNQQGQGQQNRTQDPMPGQRGQPRGGPDQAYVDEVNRQRGTSAAPGQDKTYQVRNPATGETRTVTQREWREGRLGQAGFEKPADMPEDQPA